MCQFGWRNGVEYTYLSVYIKISSSGINIYLPFLTTFFYLTFFLFFSFFLGGGMEHFHENYFISNFTSSYMVTFYYVKLLRYQREIKKKKKMG